VRWCRPWSYRRTEKLTAHRWDTKKYIDQINQIAADQFEHLGALPTSPPALTAPRKPGFVNQDTDPKALARWI
jgi:hypothetical protein